MTDGCGGGLVGGGRGVQGQYDNMAFGGTGRGVMGDEMSSRLVDR